MASSNRHWPSMFKSKPCNSTHHQWQHDIISSSPCNKPPYAPGLGEERTPEPKPRWNPRPEQIRILEAIFNSGMVNPPREEIRKIRSQLQEYGQVGDANVFYWFQNRKSRSKHKQRQLHNSKTQPPPTTAAPPAATVAPSPSSSSSDKSSEKSFSLAPTTVIDLLNSPTASVNQPFFNPSTEFLAEPFFFPVQQNIGGSGSGSSSSSTLTQDFCFNLPDEQNPSLLLSELMLMSNCPPKKDEEEHMKLQQQFIPTQTVIPPSFCVPSPPPILRGSGPTKSTVLINDVCVEVGCGPFNVREAFGDDSVLVHSTGQPVLTDDWGVTLQPLHHGAVYYLLRTFTPSPHQTERAIHLI